MGGVVSDQIIYVIDVQAMPPKWINASSCLGFQNYAVGCDPFADSVTLHFAYLFLPWSCSHTVCIPGS